LLSEDEDSILLDIAVVEDSVDGKSFFGFNLKLKIPTSTSLTGAFFYDRNY